MKIKIRNSFLENGENVIVMGILNVTPDSFSDGGTHFSLENAKIHAKKLLEDGAEIIDIGGQSTRPGYSEISPSDEWERIKDVVLFCKNELHAVVSVDTYFPEVAENALKNGADIINDVSGKFNEKMAEVVKKYNAGWIIMHNGMGAVDEVRAFFDEAEKFVESQKIDKEFVCFDMGIGFNKNYESDISLLANVKKYKKEGFPLLLGTSRKRVIGASSGQGDPLERVYGNIAADTAAILGGVDIVRIHDVAHEIQGIKTANEIRKNMI